MESTDDADFRDDLRRSWGLFRGFLTESTHPDDFYTDLAVDTRHLIEEHIDLAGLRIADFGGGPGFYSEEFTRAGALSVVVDTSPAELRLHARSYPRAVAGDVRRPPLAPGSVDLAFSSNLLEHVPDLAAAADAMVWVVRPGGWVVISYTVWWGPWGGHETSPWHYLGGHRAARRYRRRHGEAPKNLYGETMYAASVAQGLRWVGSRGDLEVLSARPRYLPPCTRWLLRVPVLRELVTWNLWLVLRKPV